MAASAKTGPDFTYGNLDQLIAAVYGSGGVPDPNQDAGPSSVYQGWGFLDVRLTFLKDKITGYTGVAQSHLPHPYMKSIAQIPFALATNNIAAAQNVTSGTAMTLAVASAGITTNIPINVFSGALNGGAVVTAALALDFGFAFGNCTAGSTTIQVASSANMSLGMPLVIAGVGNSGGTVPLLTNLASITDATHIVVTSAPLASNATAPIGTGNLWGPSEIGFPVPTAAYPFFATGPGLFLDYRQTLARGVSVTGASGGAGGTFTVRGWDIYGQPMTSTFAVASGISTGYSLKCFKYIASVTPNFTDAHNYSAGTADIFDFAYRSSLWEDTQVHWAGAPQTSVTGWVTADTTSPATAATGDVRGTIQTGTAGPGSGIGSTASNGSVVSLALSGNRLDMAQFIGALSLQFGTQANPVTIYGTTQF